MTGQVKSLDSVEYGHLLPDVRPYAALDDETRIARVRVERWIDHRAASLVLFLLQESLEQPLRERMENILLLGESGMGKTMILRKFERINTRPFDARVGVEHRSVVVVRMPHEPTEAAFADQLFTVLRAPRSGLGGRQDLWGMRGTAFRLLREIRARVLVIDEINSILVGTPRQQRLFLQLLRFLSNELAIALAGIRGHWTHTPESMSWFRGLWKNGFRACVYAVAGVSGASVTAKSCFGIGILSFFSSSASSPVIFVR
jgi:hypothetical protein